MATNGEVHVGDVGTIFEMVIESQGAPVDISDAFLKQIILRKPTGPALVKTAEFSSNGVDGAIRYVSVAGDIVEPGQWSEQAHVKTPAGEWYSSIVTFDVVRNLS